MIKVTIPISELEVQMHNGIITTPVVIRLDADVVDVDFVASNTEIHFEFALAGSVLRMVVRDMAETVGVSVIELYDFSNPPAPNNRLHLTGLRSATASR